MRVVGAGGERGLERLVDRRAQRARGVLEVVAGRDRGRSRPTARPACASATARGRAVSRACPDGRPRRRRRSADSRASIGSDDDRVGQVDRQRAQPRCPRPVASTSPPRIWLGTSAPSSAAMSSSSATVVEAGGLGGQAQCSGGVGRAAGHAARDRDALVDLQAHRRRRPSPCARGRRASAAAARFGALRRRGRRPRRCDCPATSATRRTSSQSVSESISVTTSWRPSGALRADEQAEVDLRPRLGRQDRSCAQASRAARGSPAATGARRARRRDGRARASAARARSRTSGAAPGRERERAGERLAAVRERRADELAQRRASRRRAGALAARRGPSRRSAPARRPCATTARRTCTSQASWASTDGTP